MYTDNMMKKKNRIRLNKAQLRRIIKESVKKVLKESNYDNYKYFYPDGTGGTDVSAYPYSSDIGRLENDGNREDQMDYDWEQLGYPPKIGTERRRAKCKYITIGMNTMH